MSSDYIIFLLGGAAVILGWFINLAKSLASKRMDNLEVLHEKNYEAITDLDHRLVTVEATYVPQADLRELIDILRVELDKDLDKSFNRVHSRIDEITNRASNCTRYQAVMTDKEVKE